MLWCYFRARELNFEKLRAVYRETCERIAEDKSLTLYQAEANFEDYIREEFFRHSGAFYAIWEEDGQYLSALRMEPYRDGFLLTSLETHPDYRRNGYGEKLLSSVIGYVNKPVYAHVYRNNIASLALHKKCGFERILDYAVFLDGTVSQNAWTLCRR